GFFAPRDRIHLLLLPAFPLCPRERFPSGSQATQREPPITPSTVPISRPPRAPMMERTDSTMANTPSSRTYCGINQPRMPHRRTIVPKRSPVKAKLPGTKANQYKLTGIHKMISPARMMRISPAFGLRFGADRPVGTGEPPSPGGSWDNPCSAIFSIRLTFRAYLSETSSDMPGIEMLLAKR